MRLALRILLSLALSIVGVLHFTNEELFVRIVPSALPYPRALVWISGVCEIALALAVHARRLRRASGYALVLLLVAVFPANVNMVVHPELAPDVPLWALWLRLPLQAVFIAWALYATREPV